MDTSKYMIIIKGEFKTRQVKYCDYDEKTLKYSITYSNGKEYLYSRDNVIVMSNPIVLNPKEYLIETKTGKLQFNIETIYEFSHQAVKYWHIVSTSLECDYKKVI